MLLISALAVLEYVFFKQRELYKKDFTILKSLSDNIEILKTISYLPTSKLNDLAKIMDECTSVLFKKEYDLFKLVIPGSGSPDQIFGYLKSGSRVVDNQLSEVEKKFILNLQAKSLSADSNGLFHQDDLISVPLVYSGTKAAYFILKSRVSINKEEVDFLNVLSSSLILVLRRINFDKSLSLSDQLRALNVKW